MYATSSDAVISELGYPLCLFCYSDALVGDVCLSCRVGGRRVWWRRVHRYDIGLNLVSFPYVRIQTASTNNALLTESYIFFASLSKSMGGSSSKAGSAAARAVRTVPRSGAAGKSAHPAASQLAGDDDLLSKFKPTKGKNFVPVNPPIPTASRQ